MVGTVHLQPLLLPSTSSNIRTAQDLPPQLREARRGASGQVQHEVDLPLGLDHDPGPRYRTPLRVSSPVHLCDCGGVGNGSRRGWDCGPVQFYDVFAASIANVKEHSGST
jgi:hypothetical protein